MILDLHPDMIHGLRGEPPWTFRAIGYWRVPLRPDAVAEAEAILAGNGRARIGRVVVSASVEGTRRNLAEMHAAALLPDPADYVDLSWDLNERAAVAAYLRSAPRVASWLGWSTCRMCGCANGSTDQAADGYIWPEGFAHYIEAHAVRPPPEFLEHVRRHLTP